MDMDPLLFSSDNAVVYIAETPTPTTDAGVSPFEPLLFSGDNSLLPLSGGVVPTTPQLMPQGTQHLSPMEEEPQATVGPTQILTLEESNDAVCTEEGGEGGSNWKVTADGLSQDLYKTVQRQGMHRLTSQHIMRVIQKWSINESTKVRAMAIVDNVLRQVLKEDVERRQMDSLIEREAKAAKEARAAAKTHQRAAKRSKSERADEEDDSPSRLVTKKSKKEKKERKEKQKKPESVQRYDSPNSPGLEQVVEIHSGAEEPWDEDLPLFQIKKLTSPSRTAGIEVAGAETPVTVSGLATFAHHRGMIIDDEED